MHFPRPIQAIVARMEPFHLVAEDPVTNRPVRGFTIFRHPITTRSEKPTLCSSTPARFARPKASHDTHPRIESFRRGAV